MRIALMVVIQFALQGCVAPIVAGGTPDAPSFLILRDDRLLTSLTVACEPDGHWQTQWEISGETTSTAIEYGVAPEGMTTIVAAAPIRPRGQICNVEVHSRNKSGKTFVDKSLWILDPYVRSCGSERSCATIIRKSITDATPHVPRMNALSALDRERCSESGQFSTDTIVLADTELAAESVSVTGVNLARICHRVSWATRSNKGVSHDE
jgi:hypothetical protein